MKRTTLALMSGLMALALLAAACGAAPTQTPVPPSPTARQAATIQNVVWQWVSLKERGVTATTTTVPDPAKYTITLHPDGTLTGKADCNSFTGAYKQQQGFAITLGASTLAFCGETSLDRQFLTVLATVAAGGPDGAGGFALETAGGEKRLTFRNGGLAQ